MCAAPTWQSIRACKYLPWDCLLMCLNLSTCLSALFTSGLNLGSCSGSNLASTLPLIAAMPAGAGPAAPCPRQVQELHPATQSAAGDLRNQAPKFGGVDGGAVTGYLCITAVHVSLCLSGSNKFVISCRACGVIIRGWGGEATNRNELEIS